MSDKRRKEQEHFQVSDKPTSHQPTDAMGGHEGVEGHGDQRDEYTERVSKELNARSEFITEAEQHAREHPPADDKS